MKKMIKDSKKHMSSVKVGIKGQIVIPKEVREMFDIKPGDTLILLADSEKGIAIQKSSFFKIIADAIFNGKAKEIYPEHDEEETMDFAKGISEIIDENKEGDNNVGDSNR